MRAGLWGPRGFNELLDTEGNGFFFSIEHDAQTWDYFFFNVGQPDQNPPLHPGHVDDPRFCDDIEIMGSDFHPFHAYYSLLGNAFFWFEQDEAIILQAHCHDSIRFTPHQAVTRLPGGWWQLGEAFCVWGLDWNMDMTGDITLIISQHPQPGLIAQSSLLTPPDLQYEDTLLSIARHVIFYNMMISTDLRHRFYVPVNKAWLPMIARVTEQPQGSGGPLIFAWDACFSSVILSRFDIELAKLTLFSLFEGMQKDGRIPQLRCGNKISNRSNPPMWFLAVWEIYQASGDRDFLTVCLPVLEKNYQWWKLNRMRGDYSFSWGSDNESVEDMIILSGKIGAVYESGLDDSPVFEDMALLDDAFAQNLMDISLLDQSCIDLSSIMYMNAEILRDISAILEIEIPGLDIDLENFQHRVHGFFDLARGLVNSHKAGHFNPEITPLVFYPLLTTFLTPEELALLESLFYSDHFQGGQALPSLSRLSPSYHGDGDYWKGRVWPPLVFLAARGFKNYHSRVYQDIRSAAELILIQEWKRHGHVHENYSCETGMGEATHALYARSCPFYSWGGLLGIL